jgi:hypothetical protein
MKRLYWRGIVTITTLLLKVMDAWLWPQLDLTHRIVVIQERARLKLDNQTEDKDNAP